MAGLARICKLYGSMVINGRRMVWDYAKDVAVSETEMTPNDWIASERARTEWLLAQLNRRAEAAQSREGE